MDDNQKCDWLTDGMTKAEDVKAVKDKKNYELGGGIHFVLVKFTY